jgi:hypothetical protein
MSPRYNLGLRNQSEQVPKPLIVRAVVHTALPDDITGIIVVNSLLLSCTILEVLRERENFRVTVVVGAVLNHGCPSTFGQSSSPAAFAARRLLSKDESLLHTRSRLPRFYAAFLCPAFNFAHRARWNAAILLREAADMVRLATGAGLVVFAAAETNTGCDPFRTFAHLAFCARAIFRREAADMIRIGADGDADADVIPVGCFTFPNVPVPFSDSIAEIAVSNFSICDCASRRSARSC